ncbi:MAG: hypothetical protein J6B01_12125 [Ruminococcus sp.]|nr:hypothetical protein [Ruminococcus sp.]
MIKGVSRQIIEVNNAESLYFDKAVFYLKPGVRILPQEVSSREIDRYLTRNNICSAKYKNFRKRKTASVINFFCNILKNVDKHRK